MGLFLFIECWVTLNQKHYVIKKFTLNKTERLKSRKLIEQLFKEGKSFSNYPFKVLYILSEIGYAPLQSGFAVSKRNFKKAVERNRIKRLMREGYRLQKKSLAEKLATGKKCMNLFFIYSGNALPEYKIVSEKIGIALKRLEKIIDESSASNA